MKIKALLVCVLLCMQSLPGITQQLKTYYLFDSLYSLLDSFYENTKDTNFIQAIKSAQTVCKKYDVNDSSAKKLLEAERIAMQINEDSNYMAIIPFKYSILLNYSEKLSRLLQSCQPVKESAFYASALHNDGILCTSVSKYHSRAKDCFSQAFKIRKKILPHTHPDYAESLFFLGWEYQLKNEYDTSLSLMLSAIAIRESAGIKDRRYAKELSLLGDCLNAMHDYKKAKDYKDRSLLIWREILGAENPLYALRLCYTGLIYDEFSLYDQAMVFYTKALELTDKKLGQENHQYVWCLNGIGEMYLRLGNYEKALNYFKHALSINTMVFGERDKANPLLLSNYASSYIKAGKFAEALPFLQQAIKIEALISGKDSWTLSYYLSNIALLYENLGQYNNALNALQRAIFNTINDHGDQNRDCARAYNNLAGFYSRENNFDSSIYYCRKALIIQNKILGEKHIDYLTTLNSLANLYTTAGMPDSARILLNELVTTTGKVFGEEHPEYAKSLNSYANFYMNQKNYDSAGIFYERSMRIRKKVLDEEHPDYIKSLNSLSLLDIASGNYTAAADLLISANRLELKHILRTYTSLSEEEKMIFLNNEYDQFSYLPSLILKKSVYQPDKLQQVYNNELILKGMVLNDQQNVLNAIRKSKDTLALQLYNEWHINKIIIGKQILLPRAERLPSFDSLREATNELEQKLSRSSASFRNQRQREDITSKRISERLAPHEAAIEFTRFNLYSKKFTDSIMYAAMLILPHDSIPKFIPLFEESQLTGLLNHFTNSEKVINRFFSGIHDKKNSLPLRGDSLYKLIWEPLEKELTGVKTIYYAPAGLLHRIAFQALPYDGHNHRLIDRYNLIQLLSTRSIAMPSTVTQKPSSIQIWGNIQYTIPPDTSQYTSYATIRRGLDNNDSTNFSASFQHYRLDTGTNAVTWPQLPGTKLEIDNIKNIFSLSNIQTAVISDICATEKTFKALDGKSPQVLHIATHGFFWSPKGRSINDVFTIQQDPMFRCGLVLAGSNNSKKIKENFTDTYEDGILTAYEIAQMDLSNTDLVVLSACETALGDMENNEGIIGLQRAFKLAGVKQIVISLWRVPDMQTAELVSLFYGNWLKGQSTHEALRSAQLLMKTKYLPYDWAGFVLVE